MGCDPRVVAMPRTLGHRRPFATNTQTELNNREASRYLFSPNIPTGLNYGDANRFCVGSLASVIDKPQGIYPQIVETAPDSFLASPEFLSRELVIPNEVAASDCPGRVLYGNDLGRIKNFFSSQSHRDSLHRRNRRRC